MATCHHTYQEYVPEKKVPMYCNDCGDVTLKKLSAYEHMERSARKDKEFQRHVSLVSLWTFIKWRYLKKS